MISRLQSLWDYPIFIVYTPQGGTEKSARMGIISSSALCTIAELALPPNWSIFDGSSAESVFKGTDSSFNETNDDW